MSPQEQIKINLAAIKRATKERNQKAQDFAFDGLRRALGEKRRLKV